MLSAMWSWSFAVHGALEAVDDALERQSPEALLEALLDPALALRGLRRDFAGWYLEQLSSDREQKAQVRPTACSLLVAAGEGGTGAGLFLRPLLCHLLVLRQGQLCVQLITSPQSPRA